MKKLICSIALVLVATLPVFSKAINVTDSSTLANKIHNLHDKILEEGNTVDRLEESDLANLPIGIVRSVAGLEYIVMIDSVRFTPQGAYLNAYVSLEWRSTGRRISFAATDIAFHPGGISASLSSKLLLVDAPPIEISEKIDLLLPADGSNYVEFDCNGFKAVNVNAIFEFDPEMLQSADPQQDKVRATFNGNFTDWNALIASVAITPFKPSKFKDITIVVNQAFVDYSDLENPTGIIFPTDYNAGNEGDLALWQGFYLQSVSISMPRELDSKKGTTRIDAQNLIIDKQGVSGNFGASNLFGTEEGTMNGWPFSIDSLGIQLVKNNLNGAAFKGKIGIPPFDSDKPVDYSALIFNSNGESNYSFYVETNEELSASVLAAKVTLTEGSAITITKVDGKFKPEAKLNGMITVEGGEKLNLKEVTFEQLHLASEKPYIRGGNWKLVGTGEQKVGKYPVSLSNIALNHSSNELRLSFDAALNLMNKEDKGFGGMANIAVVGGLEETNLIVNGNSVTEQKWEFKKIEISEIAINVKTKSFELYGSLAFYDQHEVFGNGFRGEIDATFNPGGTRLKVIAQFGNVEGLRYWYVDGRIRLPVPIGTGFGIYGFGGGAYYHMALERPDPYQPEDFTTVNGEADKFTIGTTRSGTRYLPDADTGLGLKAMVILGTIPSETFNSDVGFEVAFNSRGGIRFARFTGEGYFMTPIENRKSEVPLYAEVVIEYDFENKALHATMDTYVNVGNVIRGIHPKGLAGRAVLHFGPEDWYIHIGTPSQRIGLNFIGLVETGAYFMVGTYIEDFPNLADVIPLEFVSGLEDDLDIMRDESALATGGGIAFGSSMKVSTGRIQILMLYGEFGAGLGFDVMLRDYGDANCVGETDPIGINGWYASGQAWAYMQGAIGIRVDLKFIKGEFEIFNAGVAAIIQAKLPNPLYMRGLVIGHYKILGGLVKGNFNFKVTVGKECEIAGISSVGIKIIGDVKPSNKEDDVSVFAAPQVAFNVSIGQQFETLNANSEYKAYRVKLDYLKVSSGGKELSGDIEWNSNNDVAIFNSFEILPPEVKVTAKVRVLWEEKINNNWTPLGASGKQEFEEQEVTFTTGKAPNFIPEENVLYSYPVTSQYSFLQDEYSGGYMVLKQGQSYLFNSNEDGKQWSFNARFVPLGLPSVKDVPLSYNEGSKTITYTMPDLLNERAYGYYFVRKPAGLVQKVDENVTSISTNLTNEEAVSVDLETKEIEGVLLLAEEKLLYETVFKTSKYNTFTAKLNALTGYESLAEIIVSHNLMKLFGRADAPEVFDKMEVHGHNDMPALVNVFALPTNNWYNSHMYPTNYQYYSTNGGLTISDWRTPGSTYSVPPLDAVFVYQKDGVYPRLTLEDANAGNYSTQNDKILFVYDLAYNMFMDFDELKQKAYAKYVDSYSVAPLGAKRLMDASWYNISTGNYEYKIEYRLPGINRTTTSRTFTIIR